MSEVSKVDSFFASDGKLWQTEYAKKAIKNSEKTALLINASVPFLISTLEKGDTLDEPNFDQSIFPITKNISCSIIGLPADILRCVEFMQSVSRLFFFKNGHEISLSLLARKTCLFYQYASQNRQIRNIAAEIIFLEAQKDKNNAFLLDPTGNLLPVRAAASGKSAEKAKNELGKTMKRFSETEEKEKVFELAVRALENTVGRHLKAVDVEICTAENGKIKNLSRSEIETLFYKVFESN